MKTLVFTDPAQKKHFAHLILHRGDDVVAGYKVDVLRNSNLLLRLAVVAYWLEILTKIDEFRNQPGPFFVYLTRRNIGVERLMKTKISQLQLAFSLWFCWRLRRAVTVAQVRGASNPHWKVCGADPVTLPYYGVFDNLAYQVNGGTVTLTVVVRSVDAL